MIGEGDLDPFEDQSQPLVGTLPLTEKDPPEKPEDKDPPPSSSVEGLDVEAHDKDESITPSSPGSSDKTEETPTSPIRTRISIEYPPKDTQVLLLPLKEKDQKDTYHRQQKIFSKRSILKFLVRKIR